MSKSERQGLRKPATKFANFRKKIEQQEPKAKIARKGRNDERIAAPAA